MIRKDLAGPPDPLSAPLGRNKKFRRRFELVISVPQLLLGIVGLFVVAAGAWAIIERGQQPAPTNVVSPQLGKKTEYPNLAARPDTLPAPPMQLDNAPPELGRSVTAPMKTITIIDGSSGKRQEIVIPETPQKNTDLGEPADLASTTKNAGRPLPRPQR